MKKFAKMSLVAAVAVAGLTSTASAGSLEEAVKATDISGYVRYRFNKDLENKGDVQNEAKIVVNLKTKVNDMVTSHIKGVSVLSGANNEMDIHMANFIFANGPLTVKVGRQGLVSPLTDNGNAADGVVAVYGAGPVTLAAAYYNGVVGHAGAGVDHMGVGILGSAGPVNLAAWYMTTDDEINNVAQQEVDGFSLEADAKVGPVALSAIYAEKDNGTSDDISFLDVGASGSFGMVNAFLNYIKTGDQSGDTTFDGDTDAAVNNGLMQIDTMLYPDADFIFAGVNANVTDKVNLGLFHLDGESNDVDAYETELRATYTFSKNFYTMVRYSTGEDSNLGATDNDFERARVELKYSF